MSCHHLVRVGLVGHVGRFASTEMIQYARGSRVVCRTSRGLEVGEVLTPISETRAGAADGSLLRRITTEDELLLARITKNKDKAYQACSDLLNERGFAAVLMDVEHLFDGKSLYFYFLGEVTPQLEAVTTELAEMYETKVEFRKFVESMTEGCGPGCGTEEAQGGGCSSGACSTCKAASACSTSSN